MLQICRFRIFITGLLPDEFNAETETRELCTSTDRTQAEQHGVRE
jgi:hypothetical protein